MKRKAFFFLVSIFLLLGTVFFCRHPLMVLATKNFLHKTFPHNYSFQEITAKNDRVYIYGLHAKKEEMELTLDGVEFSFQWKEILLNPKAAWNLKKKGVSSWTDAIFPMKQYGLDLSIQSGVLQLDDQRYYFQLKSGEKKHEVGTLYVSHDPGLAEHPFLVLQLHMRGDQLISQVLVEEVPSARLLQLATFAFPEAVEEYSGARGDVQLRANVIFEKDGSVDEVSTRFQCTNFEIHHARNQLAVRMDKLSGDLNYPEGIEDPHLPVWKRMQCGLALENGTLLFGPNLAVAELQGTLSLDPRVDPVMNLKGEVVGQEKPLALQLIGKGAIHEDHAYWLEFGLNLDDHTGTKCDAFLSICRPELNSLVVQIEASHLLPQQVEMLKGYFAKSLPRLKNWEVQEGSFGGKLVALFEENELSHFEIQNLVGTDVTIAGNEQSYYFSTIKGDGRLFDQLTFEADLPVAHFLAFFSSNLRDIFSSYRPDDFAHLNSTIRFEQGKVVSSASLDFTKLKESLQFGFESDRAFPSSFDEIKGGWARSQKLSHLLYGPFVRLANENLKLYGDVDLLATYDGREIELSLQIDDFLAKHPLLDMKNDAIGKKNITDGRAKIKYNPRTNLYSGLLPLQNATLYDRQFGLVFGKVNADIEFTSEGLKGHLAEGDLSFEGKTFLKNTSLDFVFAGEPTFSNIKTKIALDTDKEFRIEASHFDKKMCALQLFDGEKSLAKFQGTKDEKWNGCLSLPLFDDPLAVEFNWDPISNTSHLAAEGKTIGFECKKVGQNFSLEKFTSGDWSCFANFVFKGNKILVSTMEAKQNGTSTWKSSGEFSVAIPTTTTPLKIESDLDLELQLIQPVPVALVTSHPIHCTFTPDEGVTLSEVEMKGEGISLRFPHIESRHSNIETSLGAFHLSEELLGQFFSSGFLPAFLKDLSFCKGLKGETTFSLLDHQINLNGTLDAKGMTHPIHLTWKDRAGEFSVGDKEKLIFKGQLAEEGFRFDSIKGSYHNINADLKKLGKRQLKGKIHLDFSTLPGIIDMPLNAYVSKWKSGKGYQFDGIFTPREHFSSWGFKGKLKGDRFECGGYTLRSLEAKIEVEPGQITVENLDLTDDAGKVWINEGAIVRNGKEWVFSFPTIEIRGFQPSFLTKLGGPESQVSPLIVKTATISDLRGSLDNPQSITGSGSLRFINQANSENRLLKHLPVDVLRQIGVEAGVFVPTSGEMEYAIQNGRCYLRETRGVVSDQNRSEFLPPKSGVMGYLDFSGALFIDLQVRQRGGRQVSSPHSFKLRGTWEEPKITIK